MSGRRGGGEGARTHLRDVPPLVSREAVRARDDVRHPHRAIPIEDLNPAVVEELARVEPARTRERRSAT